MSEQEDWALLVAEYEHQRLGDRWRAVVVSVCTLIARRYAPDLYNNREPWHPVAIENLAHEVISDRLLAAGQIDYIVAAASNLSAARGLIGKHVKQTLAHRVAPNQRDNVADRIFALFTDRGELVSGGISAAIRPPGSQWSISEPTPAALAGAVRLVRSLPRLPNRGSDRLSPLFTTEVLGQAVDGLWTELQCAVTVDLIRRVLDEALTGLGPTLFDSDEGVFDYLPSVGGLAPDEAAFVDDLATRLVSRLGAEQREILVNVEQLTDTELAALLGVSRPTALKRRHGLRDAIAEFFDQPGLHDLTNHLRGAVLVHAQGLLGGSKHG